MLDFKVFFFYATTVCLCVIRGGHCGGNLRSVDVMHASRLVYQQVRIEWSEVLPL